MIGDHYKQSGLFVLGKKELEKAEEMFQLNIKNYSAGSWRIVIYGIFMRPEGID